MKIFQAALFLRVLRRYAELFPEDLLDVLLSLAYNQAERIGFLKHHRNLMDEVIGDSGAWSFAQGKSDLTIEELIAVLKASGDLFTRYFNFDTDFRDNGFENNISNQIIMENAGLKPVPVIHNFFDKEIEYYVKSGKYDWLALGSSQSTNFDDIRYAVDKIITWGDSCLRIHWFGGSKFDWLAKLPIATCDTSSWAKAVQFGYIRYWNPHEEKFNKTHNIFISGRVKVVKDNEYHFVTYPWRQDVEEYLHQNFNLTYYDLCSYDGKFNMQLVNARFYVELAERINIERAKRGIPIY